MLHIKKENMHTSKKQKVLFVLHLPPPIHGAAMMGKYIKDSKIINAAFDCHYINLATAKDLTDIGKGGIKKTWRFILLLREIHKEVRSIRPQLVYVTPNSNGIAFYKDFIVVEMLKCMGCKVVAHYHNKGVSTRQDKVFDNFLYRRFFKKLKVIQLSELLYEDIKKYVPREDVFFCPNGIPANQNNGIASFSKNNKSPRLLFLSNLLASKGVLILLDACKILKGKGYSFICDFVGGETAEINAEKFREEAVKRGLNEIAIYRGKKYGEDKTHAFENADIFVFPTFYANECFPVVLLEAMQYGLPCVSTNEGGIADIIEDGQTGFIVERKNAEALSEKIEMLINNADMRMKMGQKGKLKFISEFTAEHFETAIADILKRQTYNI